MIKVEEVFKNKEIKQISEGMGKSLANLRSVRVRKDEEE